MRKLGQTRREQDIQLGRIRILELDKHVKLGRLSALVERRLGLRLGLLERRRKKELPEGLALQVIPRTVVDQRVLVTIQSQAPLRLLLVLNQLARLVLLQEAPIERQYARNVLNVFKVARDAPKYEYPILELLLGVDLLVRRLKLLIRDQAELELVQVSAQNETVVVHFRLRLFGDELHLAARQAHDQRGRQRRVSGKDLALLDFDINNGE